MTDHTLRRLERAWRETGAPADERAFRLAEVRAGVRTRESLADLAILHVKVHAHDRDAIARLVAGDPLIRRIELTCQDRIVGPSVAYLEDALERLRAATYVGVLSRPGPTKQHRFVGEIKVTGRFPRRGNVNRMTCRAAATSERGLTVSGVAKGLSARTQDLVLEAMEAEYRAYPFWNGLSLELLRGFEPARGSYEYACAAAGRDAFDRICRARLQTRVPWVQSLSGAQRTLADALRARERWVSVEWRVAITSGAALTSTADPGRRG